MLKFPKVLSSILLSTIILTACSQAGQPLVPQTNNSLPGVQTEVPDTTVKNGGEVSTPQNSPGIATNKSMKLTPLDQLPREKALVIGTLNPGLVDFDQKKFENLKGHNQIALFFSSQACRDCDLLDRKIKADNLFLPGGIVVFKLGTETQKDLANVYAAKAGQVIVLDPKGNVFSVNTVEDLNSLSFSLRKVMEE